MHKKLSKFRARQHAVQQQQMRKLRLLSRHPVAVPVVTFVGLLLVTLGGFFVFNHNKVVATDARIVIVSHDHIEQTVPTREPNVGALLAKMQIKIGQGDVVEPGPATPINQDDFRINIYRAVPVEVIDGGHKTFTFSAATTPRSIASQTGTAVYPEDDLTAQPVSDFLADNAVAERVVVDRATPINVNLYGNEIPMRTQAKTVGDLLKEKKIELAKGDTVTPAVSTSITSDQQILIARKGTKLAIKTEEIPMPIQQISDPKLAYGTSAIRQKGSPGKKVTTYKIILKNGKEVSRQVVQTVVVAKPVKQIVVVGVNLGGVKGDMALAGISPSDYTYVDYVIEHESHWNPAAINGSGCAGLGQACPGSKLAAACPDWQTDPVCQLRYFSGYASRYGGWYGAYVHKVNTGWW